MANFRNLVEHNRMGTALRWLNNGSRSVDKLDARAAYRLWAPTYIAETTTSFLDAALAGEMLAGLQHTRLLDAGCGIGRRIANLRDAVGLDLSPEMLAAGGAHNVVSGDVREMPFPKSCFDMIWCRLVLGHIPNPLPAYREFARVCMPGGYLFVTDFHPDAVAAGHKRSFTDEHGRVYEVEHYVHQDHIGLAQRAGLSFVTRREGVVGESVRDFYACGIGLEAFQRDLGLKLVAAFLFRREA